MFIGLQPQWLSWGPTSRWLTLKSAFFHHTTESVVFLFPEPHKVCSPKVDLAQEAKCGNTTSKHFATKTMGLQNKQKQGPRPQESAPADTNTRRDEPDLLRVTHGSEKGSCVGSGQGRRASWKGAARSLFPQFLFYCGKI